MTAAESQRETETEHEARIAAAAERTGAWVAQALERAGVAQLDWMMVCGSGIGSVVEATADEGGLGVRPLARVALDELGLPAPAVAGHGQSLVLATVAGTGEAERTVLLQTGRVHPYEGHDVRLCVAALAGALAGPRPPRALLLTAAVGGLVPGLAAGDLALLRDQIGLFGPTPLRGARFVDCSSLYARGLRAQLHRAAEGLGLTLPEAVYFHARGPQYETPAECEAARRLGGEVVGMSTTYEAVLAAAHGVPCGGVAVVANAAGEDGLDHADVERCVRAARGRLAGLLRAVLGEPPAVTA